jgi:prepilin-type N-terminal cleavage/methylation domain-containing protein
MFSLKKQKGFTIVELLIVIVVIGILATLVIVTFTGVQQKARDSQRKTDINAVESHVQTYYAENDGKYPTLANLQSAAWVSANLKGLDPEALKDPKGGSIAGTTTASAYGYAVTPANCDNGANGDCTNFTVTSTLEAGGTYAKQSNN